MSKRITFLASGTRGDIQPYLALGLGLRAVGAKVTIATHAAFKGMVDASGLYFALIEPNPTALMMQAGGQMALTYQGNLLHTLRASLRYFRAAQAGLGQLLDSALNACRHTDIVVAGLPTLWGIDIAAALGVPCVWAFLQPFTRTATFVHPMLPLPYQLNSVFNRASYRAVEWATWLPWRAVINRWRRAKTNLVAAPIRGRYTHLYNRDTPVLYGFSRSVVLIPSDWPSHHHITGYWFLDDAPCIDPTLREFVAAHGARLIYVGVGSMQPSHAAQLIQTVGQSLHNTDTWAVMLSPAGQPNPQTHERILWVDSAPHGWLLPQMRAIMHHGGAGTTAAALRAGKPQIVTPVAADQFFWAERAHALGVAPRPVPLRQLDTNLLTQSIRQCIDDPALQGHASTVSSSLAQENGVARTIERFSVLM